MNAHTGQTVACCLPCERSHLFSHELEHPAYPPTTQMTSNAADNAPLNTSLDKEGLILVFVYWIKIWSIL